MITKTIDLPAEFDIPDRVVAAHLSLLSEAAQPQAQRSTRLRWVAVAAAVAVVLTTAVATAAVSGLFDRDVTRADIDDRVTTVTRTVVECTAPGECAPPREETLRETRVFPADGVTFVDPDGKLIIVTPATGTVRYTTSEYARELVRSLRRGHEIVTLPLPDGGTRSMFFAIGEGRLRVEDIDARGFRSEVVLQSGDVVPLLPGTLEDEPLTPDKAVTFDLEGGAHQVWVYPQRNDVYVGRPPWHVDGRERSIEIPREIARRYALTESAGGRYVIPVATSGGNWSFPTDDGATRTVTWRAGDHTVAVTDRDSEGAVLRHELLAVGRRVNAG